MLKTSSHTEFSTMQSHRSIYYWFMQGLSRITPSRYWRKELHYLSHLGSFAKLAHNLSIRRNYKKIIKDYRAQKTGRQASLVVYSCITGGYDLPIKLKYLNPEFDYVMFVENPEAFNQEEYPWEFRKLPFTASDNIRNARYPKIMYYDVLPGYKEYLWIDSNIDLLSNLLYEDVDKLRKSGAEFAISRHPHRDCIYEEAEICIKMQKDNPEIIRKQCRFLKEEGYPEHFGLFENNVIYRKDTPDNRKVSQTWWEMLNRFSRRDQLSLMYAVWKTQTPKPLPMNEHSYRNLLGDTLVRKHFQKRVKAC